MSRRPGSRRPRSCPRTSSTARCGRAGSRTSSARRRSRTSWRSRSRPPRAAARRSTTCCSPGRPGSARPRSPRSSPPSSTSRSCRRPGPALERKGDVAAFLTALEPRSVFFVDEIHRLPAGARGDLLSGDGGPLPADHRRPGRRRAGRDDRSAAVHADRRDHPDRPADHAAARPLRDPAPARALRPGRPGADRAPLGAAARRRDRGRRRGRDRAAQPRHPARRQPPAQAGARLRRGPRRAASSPAEVAAAALDLLEVDHEGLDRLDREILRAICEKFGGGPVGLSTLAVAVGEEQDTIEDVYEPYLLQRGLIERTPRGRAATRRAYRAPRARAARAADLLL